MIPKLTTDQRLDQIQEVLVDLVKLAGKTADDVTGFKHDVSGLKHDVSGLKHDVSELKHDVSDIKNELEKTNTKIDKLTDKVIDHQVRTDSRLHKLETRTGLIHV